MANYTTNWVAIEQYKNMPNDQKGLYNGYTIEQIESRFNPNMPTEYRREYMANVRRVIDCQMSGCNLHEIETLKNTNHYFTSLFLFI